MTATVHNLRQHPQQWVDLATVWPHLHVWYRASLLVLAGYEKTKMLSADALAAIPFNQLPIETRAQIRQHFLKHAK